MVTWEAQIKALRGLRGQETGALQDPAAASGRQRDQLMQDNREILYNIQSVAFEIEKKLPEDTIEL